TDGSANLSGYNLPVDRVAAACGRIDALAKAAKRAGDLRPIDHIRAESFLGMTDGTYAGLDNTTILELLRDQVDAEAGTGNDLARRARSAAPLPGDPRPILHHDRLPGPRPRHRRRSHPRLCLRRRHDRTQLGNRLPS
ncbi:MAG: hypothetical protein ABR528_07175, partial [Pseudonocardiaceae bacterium]